jgi:hypothetical protein
VWKGNVTVTVTGAGALSGAATPNNTIDGTAVPANGWAFYNLTDNKTYMYSNGAWQTIGIRDPEALIWKGTHSTAHPPSALSSPQNNWAYYNSTTGNTYVYTTSGGGWQVTGSSAAPFIWKGRLTGLSALSCTSTNPAKVNWAYFNTTDYKTYICTADGTSPAWSGTWVVIAETDPNALIWKGVSGSGATLTHANITGTSGAAPLNITTSAPAQKNWAYYNTVESTTYICTIAGTSGTNMAAAAGTWQAVATNNPSAFIWKGTVNAVVNGSGTITSATPANIVNGTAVPANGWAFYNSGDNKTYIYNGATSKWEMLSYYDPNALIWMGTWGGTPSAANPALGVLPAGSSYSALQPNMAYFNTQTYKTYARNAANDAWVVIAETDPNAVIWKGALAAVIGGSRPSLTTHTSSPTLDNPQNNWAYYNTTTHEHWLYNSGSWLLLSQVAAIPVTFNITASGGFSTTVPATQYIAYGGAVTQPPAPTPSDAANTFIGWWTQNGSGGNWGDRWNFASSTVTAGMTLYARKQGKTDAEDLGEGGAVNTTFTVSNGGDAATPNSWANAITAINAAGAGAVDSQKNYVLNVTASFVLPQPGDGTYNPRIAPDYVTVVVRGRNSGNGAAQVQSIALSGQGNLLEVAATGGKIVLRDMVLQGHAHNTDSLVWIDDNRTFVMRGASRVAGNKNNTQSNGGGIRGDAGSVIELYDTASVWGCQTTDGTGGGISTQGSVTMNGNSSVNGNIAYGTAEALARGGGISMTTLTMNDSASVYDNEVSSNSTLYGFGGGIWGTNVTMNGNSSAHDNRTNYRGGGIYGGGIYGTAITMNDSAAIYDNQAGNDGGGCYASFGITMRGSASIHGNKASNDGGGAYMLGLSYMYDNASIYDNEATQDGGGVKLTGTAYFYDNTSVHHNTADRNGGGMWQQAVSHILDNAAFYNNEAQNGGGIYGYDSNVNLAGNAAIYNNKAEGTANNQGNGGGLYCTVGGHAAVNIYGNAVIYGNQAVNTVMQSNTAGAGGGWYQGSSLGVGGWYGGTIYGDTGVVLPASRQNTASYASTAALGGINNARLFINAAGTQVRLNTMLGGLDRTRYTVGVASGEIYVEGSPLVTLRQADREAAPHTTYIDLTFDRAVTGLTQADISITPSGGSATASGAPSLVTAGDYKVWRFPINVTATGPVNVDVFNSSSKPYLVPAPSVLSVIVAQ